MNFKTAGLGILAATAAAGGLIGQQPEFRVDVDLVQVVATVRDRQGRLVPGLARDDFVLEEEGKPRPITYFANESDTSLEVGLLVDTSFSQQRVLEEERRASAQFLQSVLRPTSDQAFVIGFDHQVTLLADLTSEREDLEAAIEKLRLPEQKRAFVGTTLYDAIFLSGDEVLGATSGRKALILLTDGVDFGSLVDLDRAVEMAQRADAVIYGIRYSDPEMYSGRAGRRIGSPGGRPGGRRPGGGWPPGGGRGPGGPGGGPRPGNRPTPEDGWRVLQRLSRETGGRAFEVGKKQSLGEIFAEIENELRQQYVLGFTPGGDVEKGVFRSISLRAKNPEWSVQTREGYYAK